MAKAGYTGEQPSRIAREESYPGAWTGQEQLQEIKANNWPKAIYEIERSLRFNSADSAYLSRTPASAGNQKTWTWAGWVKKAKISSSGSQSIFGATPDNYVNNYTWLRFSGDILYINHTDGSGGARYTVAHYRDPSAWMHIVVALDTTQAVAADRLKLYVNGVIPPYTGGDPGLNEDWWINYSCPHYMNAIAAPGATYGQQLGDHYLADIHFIDGQALTPSSFTKTDATTGQLIPKAYTGTYGTSGFHLPFSDNSTAAALGTDTSGNGNTWTVNNITANVTQPALYSSPNLYTSAADVIANGTPLFSGSTFSNVYVYLVTNSGGDVGSKVFTADGAGTIGGSSWTWLHRIGAAWEFLGSYNNAEWDLWTWGSQTTATTYVMNNSAPLHMLVSSAGSPQQVSGTIATFNSTPNSGAGNDSLVDTPTNYGTDTGAGGEVRGNYCTLNSVDSTGTLTNGNLDWLDGNNRSTIQVPTSGKWYVEQTFATLGTFFWGATIGVGNYNESRYATFRAAAAKAFQNLGTANTPTHSQCAPGDVIGVAINSDIGSITFYQNNTNVWQITSIADLSDLFIYCSTDSSGDSGSWNFGQRPFAYTAPSGFKALCTANLPDPVVAQPSTVMDVKLYTGNSTTNVISGLNFSPDLVWTKNRGSAASHAVYDSVRGVGNLIRTNETTAEVNVPSRFVSFDTNGYTIGSDSIENNANTNSFVAWAWDAGSSTVTNTQGSITSSVRANASAGFSIVTYTGNSSTATVGHGLGVAPSWVIIKNRTSAYDWIVYANESGTLKQLYLNLTLASSGSGLSLPNSTTFNLPGGGASGSNETGKNYVAYCFAPVAGYSSFGSYTGNGSADGPFVYTGFRPRWVMIKASDYTTDWAIIDTARDTYNVADSVLDANNSDAESTSSNNYVDVLSNGFKLRTSTHPFNAGYTYIYAAFAESPQKFSRAR